MGTCLMPYFDRFDIVDAHYWYNVNNHGGQWSPEYEKQCRISRYFTPSRMANGPQSENAKQIYADLVALHSPQG